MEDLIKNEIQKQWFKGAVGKQIFCAVGRCGAVLDCKKAVEVCIYKGEDPVQTKYYCAKCFDTADLDGLVKVLEPKGLSHKTIDGRVLYK